MSDIIHCPSCRRKLQVPETLIGQDVQCPSCGATFVARVPGQPQPSRSSSPPGERWNPRRASDEEDKYEYDDRTDERDDDYHYNTRRRDLAPHRGALVLALGIVGLMIGLTAPVAWILGNADLAEMSAGRMDRDGEGLTQAGRICGIIGTVLMGLTFCCCGLAFLGNLA